MVRFESWPTQAHCSFFFRSYMAIFDATTCVLHSMTLVLECRFESAARVAFSLFFCLAAQLGTEFHAHLSRNKQFIQSVKDPSF